MKTETTTHTFLGFLAILFWSTNVAFSRSLAEALGFLTTGTILFIAGGILALLYQVIKQKGNAILKGLSMKYVFWCGLLFVVNATVFEAAIGLSANRTQAIVVGLINYLWPVLSLFFSIFILKKKPRRWLGLGAILALAGMVLAATGGDLAFLSDLARQSNTLLVYGLGAVAAVTWGLYSNLSRKWASENGEGAVPVFLLATGLVMGGIRLFVPEQTHFTIPAVLELVYVVIFPTILAYVFWDSAMRKGQMITVVSLSYFIPLFSTLISMVILGVRPGLVIWAAAALIIMGAWLCKTALPE